MQLLNFPSKIKRAGSILLMPFADAVAVSEERDLSNSFFDNRWINCASSFSSLSRNGLLTNVIFLSSSSSQQDCGDCSDLSNPLPV